MREFRCTFKKKIGDLFPLLLLVRQGLDPRHSCNSISLVKKMEFIVRLIYQVI